jgi:hypothetical protein
MIGVFDDNEDLSEHSFTGRQFTEMSEAQQEALLRKKSNLVFSRAEPKHKQVGLWCCGSGVRFKWVYDQLDALLHMCCNLVFSRAEPSISR